MKQLALSFLILISFGCTMQTFGQYPQGDSIRQLEQSPNYDNQTFHNKDEQSDLLKSSGSYFGNAFKLFFLSSSTAPSEPVPVFKQNLMDLNSEVPTVIWFGHSSYLINYKGFNILVDPVLNSYAAPLPFLNEAYPYADNYTVDDLPMIDLLVITHDHYDHLDIDTVKKLQGKVRKVITPLGVTSHLQHWGYSTLIMQELDWYGSAEIKEGIKITSTPAQHFSGRDLTRMKTQWASYALEIDGYNIFLGGDSGYSPHFKEIGDRFKYFDLAILENGQYNKDWPKAHSFPLETLQAAKDLNASVILPVHWAKFTLSTHKWDTPIKEILKLSEESGQVIATPMVGESYILRGEVPNKAWWDID